MLICFTVLQGFVKVGAINVDEHKSIGQKYGIRGFPTIKIFGLDSKPEDYNGPRTAAGIVDAALNAASQKVRRALGGKKTGGDSKVSCNLINKLIFKTRFYEVENIIIYIFSYTNKN